MFPGEKSQNKAVSIIGNEAYLPPEVKKERKKGLKRAPYSRKSDIWRVAIVAYKCSTGKLPGRVLCAMFISWCQFSTRASRSMSLKVVVLVVLVVVIYSKYALNRTRITDRWHI